MPRVCTVCVHPERAAIDQAIVAGAGYRNIAKQFSIGYSSVSRHAAEHIAAQVKQVKTAQDVAQALDVVKQLKTINAISLAILSEARKAEDHDQALKAIDRIMKQLEFQAKLLGEIDTPQINVLVSPEWQMVRSAIVQALSPFPDARIAVAMTLANLEHAREHLN